MTSDNTTYEARYRRLQWLLSVQEALFLGRDGNVAVEQFTEWLPDEYFYNHYYRMNRPVVFKGLANSIFKPEAFSWDAIEQHYGQHDLKAKKNTQQQKVGMDYEHMVTTVAKFIHHIKAATYPDYYATAYDGDINRPFIDAFIKGTVDALPEYICREKLYKDAYPWIGPANTITRAHIDMKNGLLVQLIGRKKIWLFPYFYYEAMYPMHQLFTSVNFTQPDPDQHPDFFKTHGVELLLEPGDAIFLPVTWWHRVQALDASLSMSFFNFAYPNKYPTLNEAQPPTD